MQLVENYVARAEQMLNPIDYIPYVSSFSGMVRFLAGLVEIAAGAAFAVLKIIHIMLTNRGRYCSAIDQGITYSMHGMGNITRGLIALMPGYNLSLIVHDYKLGRMNYPREVVRPGVYPIMTAYRLAQFS